MPQSTATAIHAVITSLVVRNLSGSSSTEVSTLALCCIVANLIYCYLMFASRSDGRRVSRLIVRRSIVPFLAVDDLFGPRDGVNFELPSVSPSALQLATKICTSQSCSHGWWQAKAEQISHLLLVLVLTGTRPATEFHAGSATVGHLLSFRASR